MAQPYVGEMRLFAGNFPPSGWMFCEGQLVAISEFETLFQLIGTTYGGDGQSTFALPDLRGRVPVHMGQGAGLANNYIIGESGGVETVALTVQQLPVHGHNLMYGEGVQAAPAGGIWGKTPARDHRYSTTTNSNMAATMLSFVGGSQPHENRPPYLAISYIISLYGIFPSF